jgi:hypothetical protein
MKSPFPGMDPFLERHWQDIHSTFMVYAKQQLNQQLPLQLLARVEESLAVETDDGRFRVIYPDISVDEQQANAVGLLAESAAVAVADPFEVPLPLQAPPQRRLEIIDSGSGNRIVTVIELLSPVNKTMPAGRAAYRKKQSEYIQGMVNLVEIDLLRVGEFVLAMPEDEWPLAHQSPYKICIRRVSRPLIAAEIGIQLQDKLPNIAIPLRPQDRDAVLKLQPIIDDCYRDGRYHTIDYRRPLHPPLTAEELIWTESLQHTGQVE